MERIFDSCVLTGVGGANGRSETLVNNCYVPLYTPSIEEVSILSRQSFFEAFF